VAARAASFGEALQDLYRFRGAGELKRDSAGEINPLELSDGACTMSHRAYA
jgi:hypothetical protein